MDILNHYKHVDGDIQEKYLWKLIGQGILNKYPDVTPEISDRIQMEMDVITRNKFTNYILMIWDIHDFCRSPLRVKEFCQNTGTKAPPDYVIPLGPGRGSVGGSCVCYIIDIHECDPLLFGLYFERFLNSERIAYPDIDFDISQRYRHIVLSYIGYTYGYDKVAQIITYQTLSTRTVFMDVMKTACVPNVTINYLKTLMPQECSVSDLRETPKFMEAMNQVYFPDLILSINSYGQAIEIFTNHQDKLSLSDVALIGEYINNSNGTPKPINISIKSSWTVDKVLTVMSRLEGLNKHESTHAAGVVVTSVKLDENVPLMKKGGKGVLACQYDMVSLEALGYLKMDALGLRTVDVNHDAEGMVKRWYDKDFNIRKIPYNDELSIKLIRDGDTIGIFQIESTGFTQMMQGLDIGGYASPVSQVETKEDVMQIAEFMWISAGLAMYRPGPLDAIIEGKTMVQHIIDRKAGRDPVKLLIPEENEYLADTYGVLVYQEQVMRRVMQMTGCTLGRADILRKAMGKKDPVLMKEQMDWFVNAAMNINFTSKPMDVKEKESIVLRAKDEIEKFARYGFNKAHTVEYAHICYRNAYLKAHYPVAFYAALLNSEASDPKRKTIIIRDMLRHGLNLLPPLINESKLEFTMTDKDTIRFGLNAIKGLGENGLNAIMDDMAMRGRYKTIEEFRVRVPSTLVNKVVMTNLAKCGAFDNLLQTNKSHMYKNRASLVASMDELCDKIGKLRRKKPKKEAPTVEDALDKLSSTYYTVTDAEEDKIEYATWEKEILNYYISAHPIDEYEDEMRRWNALDNVELEELPEEFYIAGFVAGLHETIIKKEGRNKGKAMGFVTIETQYGSYEATLFPGIYESCVPYCKTGEPVVLKGKRSEYRDSVTIQGVYMRRLINSGIRDCPECHIRLNNLQFNDMMTMKSMFDEHLGITMVHFHIISGRHDLMITSGQPISLNDRIIEFIEKIGCTLSYKNNV